METHSSGRRLDGEKRAFILRELANWSSPKTIADRFPDEFGETISHQAVYHYAESDKWRAEILAIREKIKQACADEPIACKQWRMREYGKLYENALAMVAEIGVRDSLAVLRQAAEELGELRQPVDVEPPQRIYAVVLAGSNAPAPALARVPGASVTLDGTRRLDGECAAVGEGGNGEVLAPGGDVAER